MAKNRCIYSRRAGVFLLPAVIAAVVWFAGCASFYSRDEVIDLLVRVCKKEKNLEIQARLVDKNLIVFLPLDELFDSRLNILPKAVDDIEAVVMLTSRVLLSTKEKIDFYTVIAADTQNTAAEVTLIRYFDDIYKFMYEWISREEYRKRLVWKVIFNPKHLYSKNFDFLVEPMSLPLFLTRQIEQRVNANFEASKRLKVAVDGFWQAEARRLLFTVTFADAAMFRAVIAPLILREAAVVARDYRFTDFYEVTVVNNFGPDTVNAAPADLAARYANIPLQQLLPQ
ncbi:MAG: hypothetical protein NC924_09865 [Candidatus Omnitrophica bacterium]|nr:hypothetical protein [Candidatus Omnitrophota bacterium]